MLAQLLGSDWCLPFHHLDCLPFLPVPLRYPIGLPYPYAQDKEGPVIDRRDKKPAGLVLTAAQGTRDTRWSSGLHLCKSHW